MEKLNNFLHKRRYLLGFIAVTLFSFAVAAYYRSKIVLEIKTNLPQYASLLTAAVVILALLAVVSYILIVRLKVDSLKAYLVMALIAAVIFGIVITPNAAPDEGIHYTSAYYFSNILIGRSDLNGEKTTSIRACDALPINTQISWSNHDTVKNDFTFFNKDGNDSYTEIEKKLVTSSPFYIYTPQIIAITLSRLLNFSGYVSYYFARFLNCILYFVLLFFAIKITPVGKSALAFFGTVPIALQQGISASSDAFIIGMSFLVFALAANMLYGDNNIKAKDIAVLVILSVLLAPCKLVYFAIPFIAVLAPNDRFETKKLARTAKIIIPALTILSLVLIQAGNLSSHLDSVSEPSYNTDEPYTIDVVYKEPYKFFLILMNTVISNGFFYFSSMFCSRFGWIQITSPDIVAVIYAIILVLILLPSKQKDGNCITSTPSQKLLSTAIILAICMFIALSLLTVWTPATGKAISGIQGRYFIPLLPLLVITFADKKIAVSKNVGKVALFMSSAMNFYILIMIICTCAV